MKFAFSFLLFLFVASYQTHAVEADSNNILPILSDYTQVVKVNGQFTTQRHVQAAISDLNDHGTFTVGTATVEIDAHDAIEFLYAIDEVSSVPIASGVGLAKASEVADLDVFAYSASLDNKTFNSVQTTNPGNIPGITGVTTSNAYIHNEEWKSRSQTKTSRVMTIKKHDQTLFNFPLYAGGGSALGSPRRKLLFDIVGAAALGLSISNKFEIDRLKGQMDGLNNKVNANTAQILNNSRFINSLTDMTNDLARNLSLQVSINNITANRLNTIEDQMLNITSSINATNNAIKQLNIDVTNKMSEVVNGTKDALARLQTSFNSTFATIYGEIANLYNLSTDLTEAQMEMNNRVTKDIHSLGRQLRNSLSLAWDAAQGISIERSLTASLFESASHIPDNTFILKTDDGTPPHVGGLNGTFARFFVERVIISWIEVSDINSQAGTITGWREDFTIWIDTMLGIHNDKPWNTWDDTISLLGPEICLRPYTDSDFPLDDVDIQALATGAPGCLVWIESRRTSCEIDTTKLPNGFTLSQSGALDNTVCKVGSSYVKANDKFVFRNLDVFDAHVANLYKNPLRKQSANTLLTQLQRSQARSLVQGPLVPSDADLPWVIAQRLLGYETLAVYINAAIILSFPFVQADLKDREQFIFGRSFDGVAESNCPISTQPTIRQYDPDTQQLQIVYDGAAKRTRCKQLEYRYVANAMIELNNAQPYSLQPVNTKVTIKTITPSGNGSFTNPVTTTDIQTSISYNIDGAQLLPRNLWIFGSVNTSVYGVTFDVPEKMICGMRSYDACKGMVDFYNDEPGVRITPSLAQWVNKSSDRAIYTPTDFGESLSVFMRGFVLDDEGYPQCNVPGGVSPAELLRNAVNGGTFKPSCRGSFNWFEGNIDNQQTNIKCNSLVDPGHLWYTDNATLSAASTDAGASSSILLQPWSFSFQYRTTQSSFPILTVVTSTVKLVVTGGSSITVNINNGALSASVPIHHEVEGGVHNVWIQWDFADSKRLKIFSDLIQVLEVTNFVITASSGLGTVGVTIGNGWGASLSDSLFSLRYYNLAYGTSSISNILLYGSCHYSKILSNRCDVPTSAVNGPLPDTRSVIYAYQIPNPTTNPECGNAVGSSAPNSILLTDPVNTKNVNFLASGSNSYTLSWWSDRVDFSSGSYISMVSLGGWTIAVVTGAVQFTSMSDSNNVQTFAFPGSASALNLASTNAHYFMLVSNSIDGSLKMFIDKIEVTPTSGTYPTLAAGGNVATSIVFYNRFSMGRLYPNTALDTLQRTTMFNCELGTTITDTASWRTPLATCIVSPYSSQSAYCRHSSMCSGKCSTFTAHLNLASKTFYADGIQCDPYQEGSTCQTVCPRHTSKGYCLADTDPYQPLTNITTIQSVPGSELCNLLKHFKVKELPPLANGQRLLSIKPRRWTAVPSFIVPQGDIVQDVTTGVCPTVSSSAFNSSLLGFKLTNPSNIDTMVRVVWSSTAATLDEDDPNCVNLFDLGANGKQLTINANYYAFFKSPPCVNTQIQIQRFVGPPTNWENCGSPIDSITFPDIISTSVFVPDNVVIAVTVSKDETFQAINQQFLANAIQQAESDYQSAVASQAGQERLDSLTLWKAHLQNVTATQLGNKLIDYNDLLNMPVNGTIGGQAFKDYLAASAALAAATAASAKDRADIDLMIQKNNQLQAALDHLSILLGNLSDAEAASLVNYIEQIKAAEKQYQDALNSGPSFTNPLDALGGAANWAGAVIPGLANGMGNLFTSVASGIFGLGSGGQGIFGKIGTLFGNILQFVIVGVIAYFGITWYLQYREKKKLKDMAASSAIGELSSLTKQQGSTKGRNRRFNDY